MMKSLVLSLRTTKNLGGFSKITIEKTPYKKAIQLCYDNLRN